MKDTFPIPPGIAIFYAKGAKRAESTALYFAEIAANNGITVLHIKGLEELCQGNSDNMSAELLSNLTAGLPCFSFMFTHEPNITTFSEAFNMQLLPNYMSGISESGIVIEN